MSDGHGKGGWIGKEDHKDNTHYNDKDAQAKAREAAQEGMTEAAEETDGVFNWLRYKIFGEDK